MLSRRMDQVVLVIVFLLLGIGIVQVYSSSYIYATETRGDGLFFFKRQLLFAMLGLTLLTFSGLMSWSAWQRLGIFLWCAASAGVIATFVPGIGVTAGGAARWIRLGGGFQLEPSEFLKASLPLYLCWALNVQNSKLRVVAFLGWFIPLVAIFKQPDFGAFAVCVVITLCLLVANGLRLRWILISALLGLPAFYKLVMMESYRRARMLAFLDPWSDPASKGFQVIQSMLSFHSGGFLGVGLGQGQGKLFFLPESHTDFTLAVLGEETGFVGFFFVLALFVVLIFRGFQVSYHSRDSKRMLAALGVTLLIALAVVINSGVALGLLPTKGMALPFMSYGGSSLVSICVAVGILLSIDRENQKPLRASDK